MGIKMLSDTSTSSNCGVQQGVKNKLRFFKLNIILAKMEG